jgi:hypothetical protein
LGIRGKIENFPLPKNTKNQLFPLHFSEKNVKALDERQLQYIIPLRRNNALVKKASHLQIDKLKKETGIHVNSRGRCIFHSDFVCLACFHINAVAFSGNRTTKRTGYVAFKRSVCS